MARTKGVGRRGEDTSRAVSNFGCLASIFCCRWHQ